MKNLKNKLSIVIVGLIVFCFASTALAKDKWINLQSRNFNVVSNADEKKTKEITQKLEQFRYTLVQLYPNIPESEPVPVTVVIFRDDRSFNPFKPIYKGKIRKDISGYFQTPEQAFTEAFGMDFDQMQDTLRGYVNNKYYPVVKYQLKAPALDKNLPIQTLSEAQTQIYLGNLLLQIGRLEDGEKYLQQAKSLDASLVETVENLGFIAMKQEKYAQAKEYFQQAIARSSKNYQVYYQYANALYLMGKIDNKLNNEVLKEIKNNTQLAIKLRPEFAQAYNLAALSELGLGEDPKSGLEQAKMAVLLAPRKKQFLLTQAELQIATSDYQGAKKTIQPLLKEEDIELKTKAELLLREIEEKVQSK